MRHLVLLGDSIFDNGLYVPAGESVIDCVRRLLPPGDQATLVALDGARVASVFLQRERMPQDATHLILSVGGNNALSMLSLLFSQPAETIGGSLQTIADFVREFVDDYRKLIVDLLATKCHLTVCTIYDSVPGLKPSEVTGLCVFNDTITRTANQYGVRVIDLRNLCHEATDYSTVSPIEPSARGGAKIARAIIESCNP